MPVDHCSRAPLRRSPRARRGLGSCTRCASRTAPEPAGRAGRSSSDCQTSPGRSPTTARTRHNRRPPAWSTMRNLASAAAAGPRVAVAPPPEGGGRRRARASGPPLRPGVRTARHRHAASRQWAFRRRRGRRPRSPTRVVGSWPRRRHGSKVAHRAPDEGDRAALVGGGDGGAAAAAGARPRGRLGVERLAAARVARRPRAPSSTRCCSSDSVKVAVITLVSPAIFPRAAQSIRAATRARARSRPPRRSRVCRFAFAVVDGSDLLEPEGRLSPTPVGEVGRVGDVGDPVGERGRRPAAGSQRLRPGHEDGVP